MSYTTVEMELDHGRVWPHGAVTLPAKSHALPTGKSAIQQVWKPALRIKGSTIAPHFPPRAPGQVPPADSRLENSSQRGIFPP
jgi:hypothetical protein